MNPDDTKDSGFNCLSCQKVLKTPFKSLGTHHKRFRQVTKRPGQQPGQTANSCPARTKKAPQFLVVIERFFLFLDKVMMVRAFPHHLAAALPTIISFAWFTCLTQYLSPAFRTNAVSHIAHSSFVSLHLLVPPFSIAACSPSNIPNMFTRRRLKLSSSYKYLSTDT